MMTRVEVGRDTTVASTVSAQSSKVATPAALEHGLWLRPFRNLIYAMPPYICTPDEIDQITSGMVAVARALTG